MIQVDITNISTNTVQWSARFDTQDQANAWIAQGEAQFWWGKPQRVIPGHPYQMATDLDGQPIDPSKATSTSQSTDAQGNQITNYTFPAEYSINTYDISQQIAVQKQVDLALVNQSVGATIVAYITALNSQKLQNGTMTQTTLMKFLADPSVATIERLLWAGALTVALAQIRSANLSIYYTAAEIQGVISLFPST